MKKKFIWMISMIAIVALLAACGTPAGGGTVLVDGQPIGGEVTQAAGTAVEGATAPTGENQGATAPQPQPVEGSLLGAMWPLLLMIPIMYFLLIRPQRKQAKQAREMQEGLRVGENVVTTSGFFGKIVGVGTDSFLVEFGQDRGFKVWVRKSDIAGVRSPVMTPPPKDGEVVKEVEDKKDKKDKKDKDK
ncbi:MAG: preprotein translocase subunit YajC [Defluviitaleaceae bacterium]|nr:preprotein translocase subunit YajC [Defluviitaleaceae bacterium]